MHTDSSIEKPTLAMAMSQCMNWLWLNFFGKFLEVHLITA